MRYNGNNMIGVATSPEYRDVASEFFELFKTAWEFYRSGEEVRCYYLLRR